MTDKKTKTFDLSIFDTVSASNRGAVIELTNRETGKPSGVCFKVLGTDSTEWRDAQNELTNKRTRQYFKAQRSGRPDAHLSTAEERDAEAINLLAAVTIDWWIGDDHGLPYDGNDLPCNPANAALIYARYPAIFKEVDAFVGDMANFI